MEPVIVIGGGVGPMAGVAMHARIIENTIAPTGDESHLAVHHFSRSSAIPDRTAYLSALANTIPAGENPGIAMADMFDRAARSLDPDEPAVGGVPCNTFHAPVIYSAFVAALSARNNPIHVVNMLDETLSLLGQRLDGKKGGIGILCTTGTRLCGVYSDLLSKAGYDPVYIAMPNQERLHAAIYHPEWGIKCASPVTDLAVTTVTEMANRLAEQDVVAILPACTELPLALPGAYFGAIPLVDPVTALARGLVREAAPDKLLPLV